VCGMSIDRDKAVARREHGGRTYYFCSVGCKREFEEKIEQGDGGIRSSLLTAETTGESWV
jgi:Cu+-exporting ATPase